MAMEPGGRADKLGNEYEQLWVAKQLLRLVAEEVESVLVEGLGDDEQGVDLWVSSDGKRYGHQCKRENGQIGKWTVAALNREHILTNSEFQLSRSSSNRFVFVSSDPVPTLIDLAERTHICDGDVTSFVDNQLTSKDHKAAFESYCKYLGLNAVNLADQKSAFDLLSRTEFQLFLRPTHSKREVERLARLFVDGSPDGTIAILAKFAIENLGNKLTSAQVRRHLTKNGHRPSDLVNSKSVISSIETLQSRFSQTIAPLLINEKLLSRNETPVVIKELEDPRGSRVLMLHGDAGTGKSGVLFELTQSLTEKGEVFLPLRLDRQIPKASPELFGKNECGLPASPAKCLAAFRKQGQVFLLVDQLDALRWTSSHSSDAIALFQEIVEEALAIPNCRVVVVCRTFDMNDNQLIKSWVQRKEAKQIPIQGLSLQQVQEIVSDLNGDFHRLTPKQVEFLQTPQNLFLWTTNRNKNNLNYDFENSTDLMQAYWTTVRKDLEGRGVTTSTLNAFLADAVAFMSSKNELVYPVSIANQRSPKCLEELLSLNVLRATNSHDVVFAHQSQFDYLFAESLVDSIRNSGQTLTAWLKQNRQSLFCRERLRLTLSLLRDTDVTRYLNELSELLFGDSIRFHIKHLVITFLAGVKSPNEKEIEIIFSMLEEPEQRDLIANSVLFGNPTWMEEFHKRGTLDKWMASDSERESEIAYWALKSVALALPNQFTQTIEKHWNCSLPWPNRIERLLMHADIADDSDELFELRMKAIKEKDTYPKYVAWKESTNGKQKRMFKLLKSIMIGWGKQVGNDQQASIAGLKKHEAQEIVTAATSVPEMGWRFGLRAMSYLNKKLASLRNSGDAKGYGSGAYHLDKELSSLLRLATNIFVACGKAIANEDFAKYASLVQSMGAITSKRFNRSLLEVWLSVDKKFANEAINWLLNDPARLAVGTLYQASRFRPAELMIRRFGGKCDQKLIEQLQETILSFRDEAAWEKYKSDLKEKRIHHYWRSEIGLAQFVLLAAIPRRRRTKTAQCKFNDCKRKFGTLPKRFPRSKGGFVQSSIPSDKLHLITDKQWLEIMTTDWRKRGSRWHSIPGGVREASHETFSRAINFQAERQPTRFAKLAFRIPKEAGSRYLFQILWALQKKERPNNLEESELEQWERPSFELVANLLRKVGYEESSDIGRAFCNIINSFDDIECPKDLRQLLAKYATQHPDPGSDDWAVSSTKRVNGKTERIPDYGTSSINCVRGVAARAIQHLIFADKELWEEFEPVLNSLVKDPSPVVRIGAISLCLPLLNSDRDKAVEHFLASCDFTDKNHVHGILNSWEANQFLRYALHSHFEQLSPILLQMKDSDHGTLREKGVQWITSEWLQYGNFHKEVALCIGGDSEMRKGMATVVSGRWSDVSNPIRNEKLTSRNRFGILRPIGVWDNFSAFDLLRRLFDDDEKEVQEIAARAMRDSGILLHPSGLKLAKYFVASKAFLHSLDDLTHALKEMHDNLIPFSGLIFAICDRLRELKADGESEYDNPSMADRDIPDILLRVYHQSRTEKQKALHEKCLDAWDKMLESNFGNCASQLLNIEQ